MKYVIDTKQQTLATVGEDESNSVTQSLCTEAAFELLSRQWVRTGWSLGYFLAFTWMEQPILQLPEDLVRLQETLRRGSTMVGPCFITSGTPHKTVSAELRFV